MRFRVFNWLVALALLTGSVLPARDTRADATHISSLTVLTPPTSPTVAPAVSIQHYPFTNLPDLGMVTVSDTVPYSASIKLGGFSGLHYEGVEVGTGNLKFVTLTDRGPNAEAGDYTVTPGRERPFPLPSFSPEWVFFTLDPNSGVITVTDRISMTHDGGVPMTGLSNLPGGTDGLAYDDENPIDLFGADLITEALGIDSEGIVSDPNDGTYWVVDEYRPSLYHFDATGELIKRYVPLGSNAVITTGVEALPAEYAQRRANRGFEAVAFANNKVYAFIQSPLDNPDLTNDNNSKASSNLRIVEFDPTTETVTGEYIYVLTDKSKADKLGDAVAISANEFLVLERDDDTVTNVDKAIYHISLAGATNLTTFTGTLTTTVELLGTAGNPTLAEAGILPVRKNLFVDLAAVGYTAYSKVEGLAWIDEDTLAVINDNDFGLAAAPILVNGTVPLNPNAEAPTITLIHATPLTTTPSNALQMSLLGRYSNDIFDEGAAEIVAHDSVSQTLYVVNGYSSTVDVLSLSNPVSPTLVNSLVISPTYGGQANSVVFGNGFVAAAVQAITTTLPGSVVFWDRDGQFLNQVTVGALPDMLTFTPDGSKILVANEAEPSTDYVDDPEGSVSIIDLSNGVLSATVTTVGFADFNVGGLRHGELSPQIRIFGPGASVAQNLEPEYIAFSPDSSTAYVTLQENNALAVIDVNSATVTTLVPLGFKDYNQFGNSLDATASPAAVGLNYWPVKGLYQPDAIVAYTANSQTYLVTANEGDAREYDAYVEEERIKNLALDPTAFPTGAALQLTTAIGDWRVTTASNTITTTYSGDRDGDGDYDTLYTYGGRSFSIWDDAGQLVFDSGNHIERVMADLFPANFNASNTNNTLDNRSPRKGPEPEGVTLGVIAGRTYAFVGLERMGGIMVYDVTDPLAPEYITYVHNRDFGQTPGPGTGGDLGPEGLIFVSASASPTGKPLLIVANEISGSTSLYEITLSNVSTLYLPLIQR